MINAKKFFDFGNIDLITVTDLFDLFMRARKYLKAGKTTASGEPTPEKIFLDGSSDPEMMGFLQTLFQRETAATFYPGLMACLNEKEAASFIYWYLRFPNRMMETIVNHTQKGAGFGVEPKKGKEERQKIDPRGTADDSRVKYMERLHEYWRALRDKGTSDSEAFDLVKDMLRKQGFLDRTTAEEKAKQLLSDFMDALEEKAPGIRKSVHRLILGDTYETVAGAVLGADHEQITDNNQLEEMRKRCLEKLGPIGEARKKKRLDQQKKDREAFYTQWWVLTILLVGGLLICVLLGAVFTNW